MRMERATRRLLVITIFSAIVSIVYVYNESARLTKIVDKRLIETAELSYFTGCAVQTRAWDACKAQAKQYRKEYTTSSQLFDEEANENSN